ncbi:MAG: hypothetical protein KDD65_00950 [Bacteroidetes bacterium]|nr:hypothetical protein [Bacteroidota bacterium]
MPLNNQPPPSIATPAWLPREVTGAGAACVAGSAGDAWTARWCTIAAFVLLMLLNLSAGPTVACASPFALRSGTAVGDASALVTRAQVGATNCMLADKCATPRRSVDDSRSIHFDLTVTDSDERIHGAPDATASHTVSRRHASQSFRLPDDPIQIVSAPSPTLRL